MISALLFVMACAVLAYTGFCRLVHTDLRTVFCIRGVFWLLTMAAVICAMQVIVWGYRPDWPSTLLACCMAAVQVAASILWRDGVPPDYQSDVPRSARIFSSK